MAQTPASKTLAYETFLFENNVEVILEASTVDVTVGTIERAMEQHTQASDPHQSYVLTDGTRHVSGTLTMDAALVTNDLTANTISANAFTADTVTLNIAPSDDNHAVTKLYVDNTVGLISNSHSNLDDLDSDDHPQYLTAARGNLIYEPLGEAQAVIASHVTEPDPHSQYLTTTSGDSRYSLTTHNHDLLYSPLSHNHNSEYSLIGHEHGIPDIVDLTTTLATKLEPSNIVAGSNISLSVSGNNVTINSTGGGTADYGNLVVYSAAAPDPSTALFWGVI